MVVREHCLPDFVVALQRVDEERAGSAGCAGGVGCDGIVDGVGCDVRAGRGITVMFVTG